MDKLTPTNPASQKELNKTPAKRDKNLLTDRKKPLLLQEKPEIRAISQPDRPTDKPTPTNPASQKELNKTPARRDKNPPMDQKEPPAPMVKTESPLGSRPKKQVLRVLPFQPHQAKALLIGSASCLGPMKAPRQPMRHQPMDRKKPPLLRKKPEIRAISHLDKPMGKPTPTGLPSYKKPERVPSLPESQLPMGLRKQRFLLQQKPETGPASPLDGWRKRLPLTEPVSHKSPKKLPAL